MQGYHEKASKCKKSIQQELTNSWNKFEIYWYLNLLENMSQNNGPVSESMITGIEL